MSTIRNNDVHREFRIRILTHLFLVWAAKIRDACVFILRCHTSTFILKYPHTLGNQTNTKTTHDLHLTILRHNSALSSFRECRYQFLEHLDVYWPQNLFLLLFLSLQDMTELQLRMAEMQTTNCKERLLNTTLWVQLPCYPLEVAGRILYYQDERKHLNLPIEERKQ